VSKAIRRSGGSQNYWNIRKNLPRETANYVPAFLATMYIYEFRKEHGLQPKKAAITYFETDTIQIKKQLSFKQISELLDIPVHQLEFLNPIYKLKVIPYEQDKPHFLRLPKNKVGLFVSNEEKIYAYIDYLDALNEKIKIEVRPMVKDSLVSVPQDIVTAPINSEANVRFYTVQRGDHLKKIADKFGVTVSELKQWNELKTAVIFPGSRVKIYTNKKDTPVVSTAPVVEEWYTVQKGDTLFLISKKHPGVTVEDLKKRNALCDEAIQPGMKLKING
jgi:membrane-bound lytic murein transglycosylase D